MLNLQTIYVFFEWKHTFNILYFNNMLVWSKIKFKQVLFAVTNRNPDFYLIIYENAEFIILLCPVQRFHVPDVFTFD